MFVSFDPSYEWTLSVASFSSVTAQSCKTEMRVSPALTEVSNSLVKTKIGVKRNIKANDTYMSSFAQRK